MILMDHGNRGGTDEDGTPSLAGGTIAYWRVFVWAPAPLQECSGTLPSSTRPRCGRSGAFSMAGVRAINAAARRMDAQQQQEEEDEARKWYGTLPETPQRGYAALMYRRSGADAAARE